MFCPYFRIFELRKIKKELEAERLTQVTEVNQLQSVIDLLYLKRQTMAETKATLEDKMKMLLEEERVQKAAVAREQKRKDEIDANIRNSIDLIYEKKNELKDVGKLITTAQSQLHYAQINLVEQRVRHLCHLCI